MMTRHHAVSRHLLRRTARAKQARLARSAPDDVTYRVESTVRGPFGWRVVEFHRARP